MHKLWVNGKCTTHNQLKINHLYYFTMGNQMCNGQYISIYKNSNLNHGHSHAQTVGKWEMHFAQPIKNQLFILFHHGKSNVQWAITQLANITLFVQYNLALWATLIAHS